MMTSSIKLKTNVFEVEFEGSEDFIVNQLPQLIEKMQPLIQCDGIDEFNQTNMSDIIEKVSNSSIRSNTTLSVNSIAARMSVASASDLAIAASASLTFFKGMDKFERKDLLTEMKLAHNYYKENMRGNLSQTLKSLVTNQKLNEIKSGTFALSASEKERLEDILNDD